MISHRYSSIEGVIGDNCDYSQCFRANGELGHYSMNKLTAFQSHEGKCENV